MRHILRALATSAFLLALASPARAQITFDPQMGAPPPAPRAYRVPPQPGPDYVWIDGYWYPQNGQYRWHNGYWTHPPYPNAYWVAPYYERGQYYTGHWEGDRGEVHHDHTWDQNRERDQNWAYQGSRSRGTSGANERGRQGDYRSQRGTGSYGSNAAMTREQAQAVVRSAYQNILGREPDPGSAGYVDRVFNDHWSQAQVENELRNSVEYRQKHGGR